MKSCCCIVFFLLAMSSAALSGSSHGTHTHGDDGSVQLGAHEHGAGVLNIAIEGVQITMELEAPAHDLVGFEHTPATEGQKHAVEAAEEKLKSSDGLFVLTPSAGCKLMSAAVEAVGPIGSAHSHTGGDTHGPIGNQQGSNGVHDGEQGGHSEFRAVIAFTCEAPEQITRIDFAFFDAFANARKLRVNVIGPSGQGTFEVTRAEPTLSLAGLI